MSLNSLLLCPTDVLAAAESDRIMPVLRKIAVPFFKTAAAWTALPETAHDVVEMPVFPRWRAGPLHKVARHVERAKIGSAFRFGSGKLRGCIAGNAGVWFIFLSVRKRPRVRAAACKRPLLRRAQPLFF